MIRSWSVPSFSSLVRGERPALFRPSVAHRADGFADVLEAEAKHLKDEVLPLMLSVRSAADSLETLIADDLWPLPTYQEMLYIR